MKTKTNKPKRPRVRLGTTIEELQNSVDGVSKPESDHVVLSRRTVRRLIKWARIGAEWQADQATHNEMRKEAEAESRWLGRLEEGLK